MNMLCEVRENLFTNYNEQVQKDTVGCAQNKN